RSLNILSEDEPQPGPAKEPSVVDISSPLRDPWVYRTDASGYPRGGQSNLVFNGEEEPSRIQVSVKESTSE
ncbi:jg3533, partial [Pararge aegeria aegeria]